MATKLSPVHPGEVLLAEFLEPDGLSQYRLAKDISVPPRRINEIVHRDVWVRRFPLAEARPQTRRHWRGSVSYAWPRWRIATTRTVLASRRS